MIMYVKHFIYTHRRLRQILPPSDMYRVYFSLRYYAIPCLKANIRMRSCLARLLLWCLACYRAKLSHNFGCVYGFHTINPIHNDVDVWLVRVVLTSVRRVFTNILAHVKLRRLNGRGFLFKNSNNTCNHVADQKTMHQSFCVELVPIEFFSKIHNLL